MKYPKPEDNYSCEVLCENFMEMEMHSKNTDTHCTLEEKETWDNKSDFSGKYADLSGKPTKVSAFSNDAGYLTEHQDISGKADKTYVDEELGKKASITYVDGEIDKVEEVLATKATKSNSLLPPALITAFKLSKFTTSKLLLDTNICPATLASKTKLVFSPIHKLVLLSKIL